MVDDNTFHIHCHGDVVIFVIYGNKLVLRCVQYFYIYYSALFNIIEKTLCDSFLRKINNMHISCSKMNKITPYKRTGGHEFVQASIFGRQYSSQLCPSCLRMLVSHPQPSQQFLPWSTPSISNTLQCRMPQPSIIYHMHLSVNKSVGSKIMRTKSTIKNVKSMDEPPYPVSLHTHTYTPLHTRI